MIDVVSDERCPGHRSCFWRRVLNDHGDVAVRIVELRLGRQSNAASGSSGHSISSARSSRPLDVGNGEVRAARRLYYSPDRVVERRDGLSLFFAEWCVLEFKS
jgi:hypothetical protein